MSYAITAGMHRTFASKAKKQCPGCGLVIPRYPGRYPKYCPNCKRDFSMKDDEVVEALLQGRCSIDDLMQEDAEASKKAAIDKVMQKVNVAGLLDAMIGAHLGDMSANIWIYFTDEAKQEALHDLVNDIKPHCIDCKLYPSDKPEAKWVISILNARSESKPELTGQVPSSASLEGDIAITK